jgi:hypothetical protein
VNMGVVTQKTLENLKDREAAEEDDYIGKASIMAQMYYYQGPVPV